MGNFCVHVETCNAWNFFGFAMQNVFCRWG